MGDAVDNETWLIGVGAEVIQKIERDGVERLTPRELLIYCLWVTDYGMRNAGDLRPAAELYPAFHEDACALSEELSLRATSAVFQLSTRDLEHEYFLRFDSMCNELRGAG